MTMCVGESELRARRGLIGSLDIAQSGTHVLLQLSLRIRRGLWFCMHSRVVPDASQTSQRFDRTQEPRLVLALGENNFTRHRTGNRGRPSSDLWRQIGRAVIICIEQDKDCGAVRLQERQTNRFCSSAFRTSWLRLRRIERPTPISQTCASSTSRRNSTGTASTSPCPSTIGWMVIPTPELRVMLPYPN